MFRHMACHIDQVIDDRPVPATLHSMFQMGVPFPKRFLPYHAQLIGLELARWEPLKIYVRLQLAVELFALPVGMV